MLPHRDGVRRDAAVGRWPTPSRCCASGRLGARRARTRSPRRSASLRLPPMPDLPPFLQGRSSRRHRRRGARLRRRAARELLARPARPAPGDGHLRPGAGQVAGPAAHGPRGRRRRSSPTRRCSARSRTPASTRSSPRSAPTRTTSLLLAELRQLGGALGRPHEGGGVLSHLDGAVRHLRRRIAATPEMARARPRRRGPATRPRAVGQRPAVPQLRREPGRRAQRLRRRRVDASSPASGRAVDPHGTFVANHPVPRLYEDGTPSVTRPPNGVVRSTEPLGSCRQSGSTLCRRRACGRRTAVTSTAAGSIATAITSRESRVPTWSPTNPRSGGPARNAP